MAKNQVEKGKTLLVKSLNLASLTHRPAPLVPQQA
jgi:hypothetical protein